MSLSAAKSRVVQARSQIETGRLDDVEPTLAAAEGFLADVDPLDAPYAPAVIAQIAELRAELATMLMPEQRTRLSAAERQVRHAADQRAMGLSPSDIATTLDQAEAFLEGIPPHHTESVRTELATQRAFFQATAAVVPPEPAPIAEAPAPAPQPTAPDFTRAGAEHAAPDFTRAGAEHAAPDFTRAGAEHAAPDFTRAGAEQAAPDFARAGAEQAAPDFTRAGAEHAAPAPDFTRPGSEHTAPGSTPAAAPVAAPEPAVDDPAEVELGRARRLVLQARSLVDSGRTEAVEGVLAEAAARLGQVPAGPERDALLADAAAIREGMLAVDRADARRRRTGELDRQLERAESELGMVSDTAKSALRRVLDRLEDDDVVEALGPDGVEEYRGRVAAMDERRRAALKASALEAALPILAELEGRIAEGPINAIDGNEVDRLSSGLHSLGFRVRQALLRAEDEDAELDAVRLRADAAETAVDALVVDWQARTRAQAVQDRWLVLLDGVETWADESDDPSERPLEEPRLPKTREAVQRLRHFVHEDDGDDAPAIRAVYRAAADAFERAGVKLDAAFNAMLDEAERRPVPLRGPELDRPLHLATAARYTFEGTRFLPANAARAEALHERWQAEVAAVMAARQELYDRLAAEADEAWPGVLAKHEPVPFAAGAEAGTTIVLTRVHNRAGWDFDGRTHPFSLRCDGVVLAGDYEPHVLAALEHAWYELKLDVNDRIPWDVVAVVEGPGTVGERTVISVKDLGTGLEIGKREEWPPVPCVRLRIIGLHAGPVAV